MNMKQKKALSFFYNSITKKFQIIFFIILIFIISIFFLILGLFNYHFKSIKKVMTEQRNINTFITCFNNETKIFEHINNTKIDFNFDIYEQYRKKTNKSIKNFKSTDLKNRITKMGLEHAVRNAYTTYQKNATEILLLSQKKGRKDINFILGYYKLQTQSEYIKQYVTSLLSESINFSEQQFHNFFIDYAFFYKISILMCLFASILIIFSAYAINHIFIKPIVTLDYHARKIIQGNYNSIIKIPQKRNDEIAHLIKTFDEMRRTLAKTISALHEKAVMEKNLRHKEVQYEQIQKNAERIRFAQLQSQMKPHFFFNCLNTINTLAIIEQAPSCQILCKKLANFFRYTLENNTHFVTLKEELNIVQTYMDIQKYRFGNRINLLIDCNISDTIIIPKFLIQPLVENSVIHGLAPKKEGGTVHVIIVSNKYEHITIKIIDNGIGFLHHKKSSTKTSIGIKNIQNRLKILDPHSSLEVQSIQNEKSVVILKFKIEKGKYDT